MASSDIADLRKELAEVKNELTRLNDVNTVRSLQHQYGYYIDQTLYRQVIDLFTDDCVIFFHGGKFLGKAGARRVYIERMGQRFTGGVNGPIHGFLLDHCILQDVITVSPDSKTAKGRFRILMTCGVHEETYNRYPERYKNLPRQWMEGGMYENEYRKENGVWKISVLGYKNLWHGEIDIKAGGWATTPREFVPFERTPYPENPTGPDEPMEELWWLWPDRRVVPFHYPHPVRFPCCS